LALLLAGNTYAQEGKKDAYSKFKSRKEVSSSLLLKEGDDLKQSNPAEALNKVQEALAQSIAQNDVLSQVNCYVLLGEINEHIQEWRLANENYLQAYELLSPTLQSTTEFKKTLQGLGSTCLKLGRYDEAVTHYKEALRLKNSSAELAELQLSLSEVYFQQGDYDYALKTLDEINYTPKTSNNSFGTRLQNQKAKIYARMNNLDKTQEMYENSLNQARANKAPDVQQQQSIQETKEEIADALRSQKKYDEEIDLRNKSIEYNLESKNLSEVTKDKVEISKTLAAKGENTAALKELEEAATMADTLNNPKDQANAFLALANQYEMNGKNKEAIAAFKKYSEAVNIVEKQKEAELQEKANLLIKQKDIEELTKAVSIGQREETIQQQTVARQQLIIYGLLALILIIGVTSYFIYKNAQASKVANQLLALKSLRSQMNPHFIFNALNSVNHFIAQQDERTANKFLSEFSQLMRLVLENSQQDFISLQKEQEILSLYLKLEHYRFRDKFEYEIDIDKNINAETIEVPPMLIQPYIENAVWHGLRYKEEKGKLTLRFKQEPANLVVEITDDGIGRKKSAALKTPNQKKHISTGIKNIQERLSILNNVYHTQYRVHIEDLNGVGGTRVQLILPVNGHTHAQ
jgi:tetratricopeptide (TPR) repeat protein